MCFTPIISIFTAIIEFFVATIILLRFKKSFVVIFSSVFIYLLGFYQFTEFMMCISKDPFFWVKIGFITYTFLPAIGVHFALKFFKKKDYFCIYIIPLFFSIIAILTKKFVIDATCLKIFIMTQHIFSPTINFKLFLIYAIYYFGFILFASILFFKVIKKEKSKYIKKLNLIWFIIIIITISFPVILSIISPYFLWRFPSVYCEFGLLFTISAYVGSYIDNKIEKK